MDLTGRTIGQIRFEALIGRGGMGAVYRAFDLRLKRPVAVKVLRDHSRRAAEARGRFIREARLLSRLDHPGICRVYDLIVHPEGNLLVLELIEGQTLRDIEPKSWPLARQLELARDIADALATAHRQLILHRDLKPDNVMITPDGQVKLLDFGIARPIADELGADKLAGEEVAATRGPDDAGGGDDAGDAGDPLRAIDPDQEITLFAGAFGPLEAAAEAGGAEADGAGADAAGTDHVGSSDADGSRRRPPHRNPGETFYTLRGTTVGTVAYMSPEQALGHDLTVASDMYAFGVLLQELFTGERAYPETGLLELFQCVAKAQLRPVEGLDGDLRDLILALERRDPTARPSAEEARDRLQSLLDRPAERRRRRRRLWASLAALLLVATAVGAVVYSRAESRRQAAMAERFSRQASAVEWLLRAEYLSPAHDITPARRDVEAQLERLESQLPASGALGRAAGLYALGRARLALGDVEAAYADLQGAWDGGYRGPEVDAYLGLVTVRLHELRREEARRLPPDARRGRLEQLDGELLRPGVARLKSGRFDEAGDGARSPLLAIEPEHYPRALVALGEDRFDDAAEHAGAAAARWPWFYEAELLAAQIDLRRSQAHVDAGDVEAATLALVSARDRAAVAAEIARSDPRVATEQCLIERSLLNLQLSHSHLEPDEASEIFALGEAACRRAVIFDPDNGRALGLLTSLVQRGLEAGIIGAEDPRERLTEAASYARRAVELDDDDAEAWKSLGDIYSMYSDWELYRGIDPTAALAQMQTAYENAVRLEPREGRYMNALGNTFCFRAEVLAQNGGDPRQLMRASADAYLTSHGLSSRGSGNQALANLGICLIQSAHYSLSIGDDPSAILDEIEEALGAAVDLDDGTFRVWRQIADLHRARALHRRSLGQDSPAREHAASARRAMDRALELRPAEPHSQTLGIHLGLLDAVLDPEQARGALDRAEARVETLLDGDRAWIPALLGRGAIARLRLALGLVDGAAARVERRAGREALLRVIDIDPRDARPHLELLRLEIAAGDGAEASRARAEAALDRALELWPERADVLLARAAFGRSTGSPEADADFERALEKRAGRSSGPPPAGWLAAGEVEGQARWLFLGS